MKHPTIWSAPLCVLVLAGCTSGAGVNPALSAAQVSAIQASVNPPDVSAGENYCKKTGGSVQIRYAWFGIKGKLTRLAASAPFCHYRAKDKSTIDVSVATLYATQPTLAALAYYAELKIDKKCTHYLANPAVCYCRQQLGGSDFFLAGGYWLAAGQTPADGTPFCVFSDFSVIDSWGLAYHSHAIVRGIDLSTVLRWKG